MNISIKLLDPNKKYVVRSEKGYIGRSDKTPVAELKKDARVFAISELYLGFEQLEKRISADECMKLTIEDAALELPVPSNEEVDSAIFNVIFNSIRDWSIRVPRYLNGYHSGGFGHTKIILDSINNAIPNAVNIDIGSIDRDYMEITGMGDECPKCCTRSLLSQFNFCPNCGIGINVIETDDDGNLI